MNYKKTQYDRVINIIKQDDIFNGDNGYGVFRGKQRPFILNQAKNNLYPEIAVDCLDYFDFNKINWWNGKLTNHTLSSQVACLNHLFLIRNDKKAVLDMVKHIEPNITDILEIKTDTYMPAFIQFEATSDFDHLNEKTSTRGSNCTSIDALIYGMHKDGRKILFPIEWKYVETYGNANKANGKGGEIRKKRYTDLINQSEQLISINPNLYYFEPFFQLMRQTLWAEQIIKHKDVESIKVDDYMHIHVIPFENYELLKKTYRCSGKGLEATWRSCIKIQEKYNIISPKSFLAPIDPIRYKDLIIYLNKRYW